MSPPSPISAPSPDPAPSPAPSPFPAASSGGRTDRSPWNWLLLIPIVLPLLTFIYNRETPMLFGFPFFFWFQMLFAPIAVVAGVAVFYLSRHSRGSGRSLPDSLPDSLPKREG